MRSFEAKFQIGKNGLTPEVINSLDLAIKTHRLLRISVLKSACRDRSELKQMADKIQSSLSIKTEYKIIGFTIIVKKQ
ncbi:ribosome assembly RNA-binding protein YhbY [Candidatus Pacearchaeota archaeon]|nr:ribosome assembly RNA-binding protein YhbY [Candidatus Pacearchaeota archaeon]|tara:strand:- start:11436 stop:11669 length:234 start_codon:yes stop_codon:yes gene_type:complete